MQVGSQALRKWILSRIPYWTPLAFSPAHSGPPQAVGAAADGVRIQREPGLAEPGTRALPGPELRPAGPRLGRSRFCAHLGAGVRVRAATEGSLVGEAAGHRLRFCHGRTAVSPMTVPSTKQPATILPAFTRDGAEGRAGADF